MSKIGAKIIKIREKIKKEDIISSKSIYPRPTKQIKAKSPRKAVSTAIKSYSKICANIPTIYPIICLSSINVTFI